MTDAVPQQKQFSYIAEWLCLDFANTVGDHATDHPDEYLAGYADLIAWGEQASILSADEAQHLYDEAKREPEQGARIFGRALALREAIYRIFTAIAAGATVPADDLSLLNAALRDAPVRLHVSAHESGFVTDWRVDKARLDGMLAPIAWSAANLLASDGLRWVKACANDPCGWLFLDTTKNHSRRWCAMADCGSRAKAKRYYQRKRR